MKADHHYQDWCSSGPFWSSYKRDNNKRMKNKSKNQEIEKQLKKQPTTHHPLTTLNNDQWSIMMKQRIPKKTHGIVWWVGGSFIIQMLGVFCVIPLRSCLCWDGKFGISPEGDPHHWNKTLSSWIIWVRAQHKISIYIY